MEVRPGVVVVPESRIEFLLDQVEDMIRDYQVLRRQVEERSDLQDIRRLRREKELLEAENARLEKQQLEIHRRLELLLQQITLWENQEKSW